mmetsp:Transcript_14714/g.55455  ORF Transcript_14714/g.55455 Transcript_14714/m.55455 type:complete len:650 (+) Transcript_14714:97-2046(+)
MSPSDLLRPPRLPAAAGSRSSRPGAGSAWASLCGRGASSRPAAGSGPAKKPSCADPGRPNCPPGDAVRAPAARKRRRATSVRCFSSWKCRRAAWAWPGASRGGEDHGSRAPACWYPPREMPASCWSGEALPAASAPCLSPGAMPGSPSSDPAVSIAAIAPPALGEDAPRSHLAPSLPGVSSRFDAARLASALSARALACTSCARPPPLRVAKNSPARALRAPTATSRLRLAASSLSACSAAMRAARLPASASRTDLRLAASDSLWPAIAAPFRQCRAVHASEAAARAFSLSSLGRDRAISLLASAARATSAASAMRRCRWSVAARTPAIWATAPPLLTVTIIVPMLPPRRPACIGCPDPSATTGLGARCLRALPLALRAARRFSRASLLEARRSSSVPWPRPAMLGRRMAPPPTGPPAPPSGCGVTPAASDEKMRDAGSSGLAGRLPTAPSSGSAQPPEAAPPAGGSWEAEPPALPARGFRRRRRRLWPYRPENTPTRLGRAAGGSIPAWLAADRIVIVEASCGSDCTARSARARSLGSRLAIQAGAPAPPLSAAVPSAKLASAGPADSSSAFLALSRACAARSAASTSHSVLASPPSPPPVPMGPCPPPRAARFPARPVPPKPSTCSSIWRDWARAASSGRLICALLP